MEKTFGREMDSSREQRLIEKLRRHPELTEGLEAILELTETEAGKFKTADEVEELLIEEVRRIGNVAMTDWARGAEECAAQELAEETRGIRLRKKKP